MLSRYSEMLSRYSDLVSRYSEMLSRYSDLVSRYSEMLSRYSEIRYIYTTSFQGHRSSDLCFNWNMKIISQLNQCVFKIDKFRVN